MLSGSGPDHNSAVPVVEHRLNRYIETGRLGIDNLTIYGIRIGGMSVTE